MRVRRLDPNRYNVGKPVAADADADWNDNNAAFTCPVCSKVFIVTSFNDLGRIGLHCPACGKSTAYVTGSAAKGGEARIEWDTD
jgi:predicted RNA-binding Zn-ribbon protein involved in translation (DUF1610 family)